MEDVMLAIIGCGNPNRQDDGFGSMVIARLMALARSHDWPDVRIFDAGLDGMAVMFAARGAKALIVIDANVSGSEPGTIFEVPGAELAHAHEAGFSLHDFRWDHALHAGRKIFGREFPDDVTVYLVEAERLGLGMELTPRVAAALEPVVARVVAQIAAYCAKADAADA
jgi:hydrogenase maturation protease